ncbi:MAG: prolyl oligopeptidase family serine peptidase [Planctomycetota bacterium]
MNRSWIVAAATATLLAPLGFALAEGDALAPGENLVLDGIPRIPASIAAEVASYTDFRSAGVVAWHPEKREMLISTRFAEVSQLHEVRMPLGARKQLTFGAERASGAAWPKKRSDYFVFSRDVGGGEFYQLFRRDVATGKVERITPGGRTRHSLGRFSYDDKLAFTSTKRNGKDTDIYVMDPRDPSSEKLLLEVQGSWSVQDWAQDDSKLILGEYVSANESYLWLLDVGSGKKFELTPRDSKESGAKEKISWHGGVFTPDGKSAYVTTDKGSEFHRLALLDLESKALTPLTSHIEWDVEHFDVSLDGKLVAFVTNEEGTGVLHVLDAKTKKELALPKLPAGTIGSIRFHESRDELAFDVTSSRCPSDVWSLEPRTGKLERWTESETGEIDTRDFSEPETIRWKTFDGRTISGLLYMPPKRFTGKRPIIVSIHGGPEGQSRPGFLARTNYFLNELGVALVLPNVRGSTGFGKTFLALDNGQKREESVQDVGALLDWVGQRDDLDASRVMVMGGSYGGYMSLAVSEHYADRIRCSIDVVGISNFVSFLERTEAYRRDLRRAEYGDERDPKMRAHLEKISPVNNAAKIKKPLFVIQGKNDPRVPFQEAEQIVAAVKKNETPVWYLVAKDEGHGFAKKKNSDFQLYATVLFVKEYLLK